MKWFILPTSLAFTAFISLVYGKDFKRVCYFTNWSGSRGYIQSRFQIGDIDPSLCTHLVYAFAKIDVATKRLIKTAVDDDNGSLTNKRGRYFEFTALKKKYKHLKTMLSVGGENTNDFFAGILDSTESIRKFAENCRIYLRDRDFDGLDIDWEYPGSIYRKKFTELLKYIHDEFKTKADNKTLLLTIAAAPGKDTIDQSYDIPEIVKYVDFINVMAYDYYGSWSHNTGYNSPLYSGGDISSTLSQNWTIHYYISGGAPPEKLVMGLNAAAAGFVLKNTSDNLVGSPVIKGGVQGGPVLVSPGRRSYQEMCNTLRMEEYEEHWDSAHVQSYAVKGNQWYGYETERSIKAKVAYAKDMGLGGIFLWSLDIDDFTGNYCKRGRYPLLSATMETVSTTMAPFVSKTTPDLKRRGFHVFKVIDSGVSLKPSFLVFMILSCSFMFIF